MHSSMARIIQPFYTLVDGDVLYAVTTNGVEQAALSPVALGIVASELMWDAILTMTTLVGGARFPRTRGIHRPWHPTRDGGPLLRMGDSAFTLPSGYFRVVG